MKAEDVTVEAIPVLLVESASWKDGKLTIVFNEGELVKTEAEKTSNYTVTVASSATVDTAVVDGNTVTLTFVDGLLAAGDKVVVAQAVGFATGTTYTVTLAANGTATIAQLTSR